MRASISLSLSMHACIQRARQCQCNNISQSDLHDAKFGIYNAQYAKGRPLNAICGRGDLDAARARAYGCYDTKVANYKMALRLHAEGVVGPAGREAGLPPFR